MICDAKALAVSAARRLLNLPLRRVQVERGRLLTGGNCANVALSNGSWRKLNIFGAISFTNGSNQHISGLALCSISTIFQSPIRRARMSPSSLI
jgi:hypothetical protein